MANKTQEFGIVRNGEHVQRGFFDKQEALREIANMKKEDKSMELRGWIKNASSSVYHIVEVNSRNW